MNRTRISLLVFISISLLLTSCSREFNSRVERLVSLEEAEIESGTISKERLSEIKESVREYEEILESKVEAGKEAGNFYRLLAAEFMHLEMYGLALDNFQEALRYYPSSFTLYYFAGVCSARMSLTEADETGRMGYLYQAETYYLRAIQLNSRYYEVMYALALLYHYEMERPWDAEPLLDRLVEHDPSNTDSLFLMASVQAAMGNRDEAVYYYEAIAETSEDKDVVNQAMENRNAIMGGM